MRWPEIGCFRVLELHSRLYRFRQLARSVGLNGALRILYARRFAPDGIVRLGFKDHRIAIRLDTPDLGVALSCFGGEFDELISAVPVLRHPLIIDAGGYIGTAAIVFAKAYPEATVLSLEPNRNNFEILRLNTAAYPNIVAINKALSPVPGRLPLRNRNTGDWGFTLVSDPADAPSAEIIDTVDCTSVEALLEEFSFAGIGIMKLDIEGGEHALLASVPGWVSRTQAMCIELHDRIQPGCSEVFEKAVEGRDNFRMTGEKHISLQRG